MVGVVGLFEGEDTHLLSSSWNSALFLLLRACCCYHFSPAVCCTWESTLLDVCLENKPMFFFPFLLALSGAEAVNALRPFYFAVHPDFFGQYPKEREVNENSLKRLNGYLENLQKPGSCSLQPMRLTFYVRDTRYSSDVQDESHFSICQSEGGVWDWWLPGERYLSDCIV
uniref:T cell activation inhibitor, mitochondrial n=1 Tax=Amphilophus citrinellus TaxID=61819 RepID=A0A3Q0RST1_AMPCI